MALKHPAEDHVAKGHADPVVRIGEEGGTHAIGLLPRPKFLADPWPISGDVEAQGYLQVLGRGPQGFVLGQIVPPPLRGIDSDQASREPHLRAALQFLDRGRHVVDVERGDALEPIRAGVAELGQPVVIGPEDGCQQVTIWHAVQQKAHGRIDDTHIHPIGIHVFDVLCGDVAARPYVVKGRGPPELIRLPKSHARLGAGSHADHPVVIAVPPVAIRLADNAWGAVPELVLSSSRPQVRWLEYMVIRRYDPVTRHRSPSYVCVPYQRRLAVCKTVLAVPFEP